MAEPSRDPASKPVLSVRGERPPPDFNYVGIDAILEQMRRKAMKQGFQLNIMVVGESLPCILLTLQSLIRHPNTVTDLFNPLLTQMHSFQKLGFIFFFEGEDCLLMWCNQGALTSQFYSSEWKWKKQINKVTNIETNIKQCFLWICFVISESKGRKNDDKITINK